MKSTSEKNRIVIFLFVCYAFVVLMITQYRPGMIYLPDFSGERLEANFQPFIKIGEALSTIRISGLPGGAESSRRQVLIYIVKIAYGFFANVLMFVPLGIFLPMMFKKLNGLIKVSITGFLFSLLIEVSQLGVMMLFFASQRVFDIDDLIANTIGAAIGYIIYSFFHLLLSPQRKLARA